MTCDHLLCIHLASCVPKYNFCLGLFHTTWLELPLQTCYLRRAWTAREFSLTWAGVLCRGLIPLPMKETNVSSLLHHPTLASSAWWKDGCSNCIQQIKTLDHSRGRRESFLWFKETSRSPFVITRCPALGAQCCPPILEPAPRMWREILRPVRKEDRFRCWQGERGSATAPAGRGEAGLPGP